MHINKKRTLIFILKLPVPIIKFNPFNREYTTKTARDLAHIPNPKDHYRQVPVHPSRL